MPVTGVRLHNRRRLGSAGYSHDNQSRPGPQRNSTTPYLGIYDTKRSQTRTAQGRRGYYRGGVEHFVRRWEVFRAGSGIEQTSAPSQLFQCAETDLGDSLLKANPNPATEPLQNLLVAMRSLAVIPVATRITTDGATPNPSRAWRIRPCIHRQGPEQS